MKDKDIDLNLAEFEFLIPSISDVETNTKIGPSRFFFWWLSQRLNVRTYYLTIEIAY